MNEISENSQQTLTLAEVEELCRLYLDGSLETGAEIELEYILPLCGHHSALIDETIAVMDISRRIGKKGAVRQSPSRRAFFLRIAAVAACVAAAVVVSLPFFGVKDEYEYIAYVNGERVEGLRARQIAIDLSQREREIDNDFDAMFSGCDSEEVDSLFSAAELKEKDLLRILDEELTVTDNRHTDTVI